MRLLLALFLSFWPLTARAAGGLTLGAACSNADDNSAHASISTFQYVRCSGGVWVLQSLQPGAATDTCAAAAAGEIQWTAGALKYCDGSIWQTVSNSGASTALSGLTNATAGKTLANANFAQVWNWDTLTTGTALTIGSTSMTTGSLLSLSNTNGAAAAGTVLTVTNAETANGATAISGSATGATGQLTGVYGQTVSSTTSAAGVSGYAGNATGQTYGVLGVNASTSGSAVGVYGYEDGATGINFGVYGRTDSTTGGTRAVMGVAAGATGATDGVYGEDASATGFGGYFTNTNGGYALATGAGNVGIGTTTPTALLHVAGAAAAINATNGSVNIESTSAEGADVGAMLSLKGSDGVSTNRDFANIAGFKENGTSGDYAGYLAFATRANGSVPAERMRINSTGNVGIGRTTINATLDVNGYAKLKINASAPVACSATYEGSIAYTGTTTHYVCFCNGTNWVKFTDNTTACTW